MEKPVSRVERRGRWEEGEEGGCPMLDALSPPKAGSGLQEIPGAQNTPSSWAHQEASLLLAIRGPGWLTLPAAWIPSPLVFSPFSSHKIWSYSSPCLHLHTVPTQTSHTLSKALYIPQVLLTPAPTQRLSAQNSCHPRCGPHCSQVCFLWYSWLTMCEHMDNFLKVCLRLFQLVVTW